MFTIKMFTHYFPVQSAVDLGVHIMKQYCAFSKHFC